jgi:hypothetical protein
LYLIAENNQPGTRTIANTKLRSDGVVLTEVTT